MIEKDVVALLMKQVNKEFYSAYLYLDIANYYADQGLDGFENWFTIQAQEERDHALLMRQYLLNNAEPVTLTEIAAPDNHFETYRDPLAAVLKHEQYITASINEIYKTASGHHDYRTLQFLDWFVKEQGEEEKNADDNLKKYDLFAGDSKGLFMLDNELKTRVYAAPSLVL
ncbi:ferritin [Novisyntrophococcus fermenticellae]|uniref:ferritin n=1 Tax=Novisyntrophococcus fermenticellae TaxID=2068655 RepID=UPI001E5C966F|nr:ferritin [Novisyntrophococcus fermenticellae]